MAKYAYHRVDANAAVIIEILREGGCSIARIGKPVDICVGLLGRNYLLEIKQPNAKLRPTQERFFQSWRGHVELLKSEDDARRFLLQAVTE